MTPPVVDASAPARLARFDRSGAYRYRLERVWDAAEPVLTLVLLNPSRADATRDDPTIRRCMGFARNWGYGRLVVVNLFAYRAVTPAELKRAPAPVGPRNDRHLRAAAREAQRVVLAWGVHGAHQGRDRAVLRLLHRAGVSPWCLGTTQAGHPRHVLYLPRTAALEPYAAAPGPGPATAQPVGALAVSTR